MISKVNLILKEILEKVEPPEEDLGKISDFLNDFMKKFEKKLKTMNVKAEVFVGGSFAKKTLIKKGDYDIDVFVRFEKKENNEKISDITEKALKGIAQFSRIHGSRDYFRLNSGDKFFFVEVIPVLKVKNPKEAENITDLSYFHVNYIKRKLKGKMLDEVRLAKAFCYANKCYGAESYVNGFSGYAIELLVHRYKGFLNFLKMTSKIKEREIIDIEKQYRNKHEVLINMNSAKLGSPMILVDPTYKQRNALAALSKETFERFKDASKNFLKNPSAKAFELKKTDIEKIKKNAKKQKLEFIQIELKTDKQEGDVAGSKLMKFYRHIASEISKPFTIKNSGFEYNGEKIAGCFFVLKSKGEIIFNGPEMYDKTSVAKFRKKHKKTFVKKNKIYAREKINYSAKEFIYDWEAENPERMEDMHMTELKIIE